MYSKKDLRLTEGKKLAALYRGHTTPKIITALERGNLSQAMRLAIKLPVLSRQPHIFADLKTSIDGINNA